MKNFLICALAFTSFTITGARAQSNGQPENPEVIVSSILHFDSLFWLAYNQCDVDKMSTFFTDDLEFYHDKGGLTTPKAAFVEEMRKGLCGNRDWRLRREPIEGTVKVFPMNNYGGLISGEHIFYINETGKKEYLDGYGKFTQVWQFKDGTWKMSRVLSYDHGPAPHPDQKKEVPISPALLKQYAGKYQSSQAGIVTVITEGNTLKFAAGDFQLTLLPESDMLFFVKERELQFEFVKENNKVVKMVVYEKGNKVDEAKRIQ